MKIQILFTVMHFGECVTGIPDVFSVPRDTKIKKYCDTCKKVETFELDYNEKYHFCIVCFSKKRFNGIQYSIK